MHSLAPRGNWATVLLPLGEDDEILMDALEAQLDALAAAGVDGIYTNGTASEFYNQTEEEFFSLSTWVSRKCRELGMPLQIGVSHPFPAVALQRVQRLRDERPSAFQVILPDWFPPKITEVIAFLDRLAKEAAPVPLVLYNPPHAKVRLTPAQFLEVANAIPNLCGIKVPGGDDQWYREMVPVMERISVFIPGHHLATGTARGAMGSYSNVACLSPGGAQEWYHETQSDMESALARESRVRAFMDEVIVPYIARDGYANQAVDKLMAAAGQWYPLSPRLRWPYRWLGEDAVKVVRAEAIARLPEFMENSPSFSKRKVS
jgi:4-hydroxy-tetrahydrodipicolinate synthase